MGRGQTRASEVPRGRVDLFWYLAIFRCLQHTGHPMLLCPYPGCLSTVAPTIFPLHTHTHTPFPDRRERWLPTACLVLCPLAWALSCYRAALPWTSRGNLPAHSRPGSSDRIRHKTFLRHKTRHALALLKTADTSRCPF